MKAAIQRDESLLCRKLTHGYDAGEGRRISAAVTLALDAAARDRQIRPRGVEVAQILHGLKADGECVLAALLCDPYLRETLPNSLIREHFGEATATLVDKVNWLNTFTDCRESVLREPEQAELLRRMLVAVVNDVRAVLVKLAYRVERLRVLPRQDSETRRCVAQETLDIFAPLANRLGVAHVKWELEDLSFRYLNPGEYKDLARQLAETRAARESYIHDFMEELSRFLEQENILARVSGRPKHLYSIWKKMARKRVGLDDLYDLRAVRIIVESIADCYAVLGLVHGRWQHVPREFDDYIANPKPNGYRSLHTVVIGSEGKTVEVQIRTREMHAFAEYGVAAHWRYKEGGDASFDRGIALLRGLLESHEDDHALLEDFRSEAVGSDVFVLTPKGRIVRLTKGATPLDFAYAIHTEVGHRCRGAKVNGRMAPLTHTLVSGEQVEILTVNQGGPSRHWLEPAAGYLHTGHARGKVRQWFKQQEYEQHWRLGKAMLEKEKQRLGVRELEQKTLLARFNYKRWEDLLAAVGRHEIGAGLLVAPFAAPPLVAVSPPPKPPSPPRRGGGQIYIPGVPNPLTHFARCCNPQPGEAVAGYISVNRGVAVHRRDCANILRLENSQRQRLIDAFWESGDQEQAVEVCVSARERRGLLRDVTQVFSNDRIDIVRAFAYTDPASGRATLRIGVEKPDPALLESALRKIRRLDGVEEARVSG